MVHSTPQLIADVLDRTTLVTATGLVDSETVRGNHERLWADEAVIAEMTASPTTSTQRLRRHVTAA